MTEQPPRASVPADIGTPDRIAFGLTFRQLGIIGTVAILGWAAYSRLGPLLPAPVWIVLAIPVGAVTVVVALGRRDGLPLDVWLRHGLTLTRSCRLMTPGHPGPSAALTVEGRPVVPAPLSPVATSVSEAGVVVTDGVARRVIACGSTNVHLRTADEQAGLLDGFGRFLNSLTRTAQIVVAAQRHHLGPYADAVLDTMARLPHPALRAAAGDYAAFLLDLDHRRDPLQRQVLVVVTGDHTHDSAARALAGLGVTATALDGPAVTAVLAAAVDSYTPTAPGRRAVPGTGPTVRRPQ